MGWHAHKEGKWVVHIYCKKVVEPLIQDIHQLMPTIDSYVTMHHDQIIIQIIANPILYYYTSPYLNNERGRLP